MEPISEVVRDGGMAAWLLLPTAVLLGALHALEPGHSKTMIAAFIVAVRGTVGQAILLGLSAAVSHTAIVWVLAIAALSLGDALIAEHAEPYIMVASGVIVLAMAAWMAARAHRGGRAQGHSTNHGPDHDHAHPHHHGHPPHGHAH